MQTGRDKFKKNKKRLNLLVRLLRIFPTNFLIFIWDAFSNYSQIPFVALRYSILKTLSKKCGDNVKIGTNVKIISWDKLVIGNNVSIHSNCYIDSTGEIEIGNNVSIAHNSSILSSNHNWVDKALPIKYNPINKNKVLIKNDVWIGCGCRILAGVIINNRSIIAAGAVVNKEVYSNTIIGGIPAKFIKNLV